MTNKYQEQRDALLAEARALSDHDLDGDDLARFEAIEAEVDDLNQRIRIFDSATRSGGTESGDGALGAPSFMKRADPWDAAPIDRFNPDQTLSRALSAVEAWKADDTIKNGATKVLEGLADEDRGGVAEYVLRTSHPEYISAFRKFSKNPGGFGVGLSEGERRAWSDVETYNRATLQLSGAVLPSPLDPNVNLTNDGNAAEDPMRMFARQDTTIANSKRYITSAGVSASFDAELAESSDDTPALTEKTITVQKAQAWVVASIEAAMDQPNFGQEVANMFADAKAELEALKFVKGVAGSNEPVGIETALTVVTTSSIVDPITAEVFQAGDVYNVQQALPPRFRNKAKWQLELATANEIHRFHSPSGSEPALLDGMNILRRPYGLNANIDPSSDIDGSATASNNVLFFGDWSQFAILDRVGMSVSYVPPGVLVNANAGRPDGRVGWYAYWRVGSDILFPEAFRVLSIPTVGA